MEVYISASCLQCGIVLTFLLMGYQDGGRMVMVPHMYIVILYMY